MKPYVGLIVHYFPPEVRADSGTTPRRHRHKGPLAAIVTEVRNEDREGGAVALHVFAPAVEGDMRQSACDRTFEVDLFDVKYDPRGTPGTFRAIDTRYNPGGVLTPWPPRVGGDR